MQFRPQNSEIDFDLRPLSFDDQEQVITLLERMQAATAKSEQFKIVRSMVPICVSGWSLPEPVEAWSSKIDLPQAISVVNACLSQNSLSEDERKK